jgi:hypothetical protein
MLVDHLEGLLNHCRTPVRFGVVEAINAISKRCSDAAGAIPPYAICC